MSAQLLVQILLGATFVTASVYVGFGVVAWSFYMLERKLKSWLERRTKGIRIAAIVTAVFLCIASVAGASIHLLYSIATGLEAVDDKRPAMFAIDGDLLTLDAALLEQKQRSLLELIRGCTIGLRVVKYAGDNSKEAQAFYLQECEDDYEWSEFEEFRERMSVGRVELYDIQMALASYFIGLILPSSPQILTIEMSHPRLKSAAATYPNVLFIVFYFAGLLAVGAFDALREEQA